jgi:hypothetical protein
VSGSDLVRLRPHRIRIVCWVSAIALVAVFTAVATSLRGSTGEGAATFQHGDQLAMIGLGLAGAIVILMFTRPRVEADAQGIRVQNVISSYNLPWEVVRAVSFDRNASWASLELADDEEVPIIALQAADKERAVAGVRRLRELHRLHQARDTGVAG